MRAISLIFLFLAANTCYSTPVNLNGNIYRNCNRSSVGIVSEIHLNNCSQNPCILKRGEFANFKVIFKTKINIEKANLNVKGKVTNFFSYPFCTNQPVCKNESVCGQGVVVIKCPLIANEEHTFQLKVLIKKYFPSMELKVIIELRNGDRTEEIFCVSIGVKIR